MADAPIQYNKLFINNEWVDPVDNETWSVINPTTEKEICKVALGKKADVDLAVKAARDAFDEGSEWRNLNASARGRMLNKLADLIDRDCEILAKLETINNGMPIYLSTGATKGSADKFRYYAGWADKNHGKVVPCDGNYFAYTRHEPIGVCGAICPWNFPLSMIASKAAPCLAMGNTLVVKPSEFTPLTALYIAALVKEAGFPPGVFNVITGSGPDAGSALSHHMDVDKVSFTGSVRAGRLVMKAAAESNLKKVTLELGGKSPLIVFSDVNVDVAVAQAHAGIMSASGQICCGTSRVFVHEAIYDEFVAKSIEIAKKRTVGDPFTSLQGPQANKAQMDRILGFLDRGRSDGANVVCGGKRVEGMNGYFIEPTIVTDVKDNSELSQDEIFGPVQQIYKFKDVKEAMKRANDTTYGLAAAVFTNDVNKYLAVANSVKAGTVWVNCVLNVDKSMPFGGYRQSGIGRENGEYALREYTEIKSVIVKQPDDVKSLL